AYLFIVYLRGRRQPIFVRLKSRRPIPKYLYRQRFLTPADFLLVFEARLPFSAPRHLTLQPPWQRVIAPLCLDSNSPPEARRRRIVLPARRRGWSVPALLL
ncbi:MAG: hypothetical protein WA837_15030, partial [Xanthobacteraceae bacterium]